MNAILAEYFATRARRTAWIITASSAAFFAALLAVMFYLRWAAEEWPAPFHFASLLMVFGLTMFAVCASIVLEVAARAKMPDPDMPSRWVAIAIACWLVFLFLEVVEWVRLVYLVQLGPHTTFGATFLSLTGAHWLAVCACVCWMTWVAQDTQRRDVLAVAIFSHYLNLMWIVLVFALYFPNANLEGIS